MIEWNLNGLLQALKIIEYSMPDQEIRYYFGIPADATARDVVRAQILDQPPEVILSRTEQYLAAKEEKELQAQKMRVVHLAKGIGMERLFEIVDWLRKSEVEQDG